MDRLRPPLIFLLALLAMSLAFTCDVPSARAQMNGQAGVTNGLYGRPTAQPYFDFPNWARFSNCRPGPLPWGYDVFPASCPSYCPGNGVPSVGCPGEFVSHRPSSWYASADFAPMTIDYGSDVPLVRPFVAAPPGFALGALTTDDLNPEFNAGGKFTVGKRIFDCYR